MRNRRKVVTTPKGVKMVTVTETEEATITETQLETIKTRVMYRVKVSLIAVLSAGTCLGYVIAHII